MYFLLAFAYRLIGRQIYPVKLFSTINNMSISFKRSNFPLVFLMLLAMLIRMLKDILEDQDHIFLKFSNTSAKNNASLLTYKL